ncbi:hypothetical protein ABT117_38495 [Streptomyces sp. NPDC002262]|uniref:hypothetical protein n=1 Tax=Streptomyces sp. NPDC002262 TaxID=3154414 RepID=UPI00332DB3F3
MENFPALVDDAGQWWDAAVEDAQEGRWVRDDVERAVVADIAAATNALHGGRLPPFTEDDWYVRIGRIANWAGVIRLAARAGGWELRPVAGRAPDRPAGMTELLSGIYAIAAPAETWMRRFVEARQPPSEQDMARAEFSFSGPGTLEDLESFFYDD